MLMSPLLEVFLKNTKYSVSGEVYNLAHMHIRSNANPYTTKHNITVISPEYV